MRGAGLRIVGVLLVAAGVAHAQEVRLAAPPTTRCLTAAATSPEPVYPPQRLEARETGEVQIELSFTTPDAAPAVKVVKASHADFERAVLAHAAGLRVPCLEAAEAPALLQQRYVFQEKVTWLSNEPDQLHRAGLMKCLQTPKSSPEYPLEALQVGAAGRVIARLTFESVQPTVQIFAPPELRRFFGSTVEAWAKSGYRLPCFDGTRMQLDVTLNYMLEDDPRYGFKGLEFIGFLSRVKGIQTQRLQFDTNQMGCPFEVSIQYRQPYLHNSVAEFGEPHFNRRALMNWLSVTQLNVSGRAEMSVFGDTLRVTVPCINIDLKPKES